MVARRANAYNATSRFLGSLVLAMNSSAGVSPVYLLGIDGGGSGTRALLADAAGRPLAQASGAPAGLALGVAAAWQAISEVCAQAFAALGRPLDWSACVLGCGLAGVNHPGWRAAFIADAPGVRALVLESDAFTTLLGAHGGAPGAIVALGTGSIGAALLADGTRRLVGGFGFPAGDEASGAWLGLRAVQHAQCALDGRAARDAFAEALLGAMQADNTEQLVTWLSAANQTAYAGLAPLVFAHAAHPFAANLLATAGRDVAAIMAALDPAGVLPVALCGGLADALAPYLPAVSRARLSLPRGDSAQGALQLAAAALARAA